MDPQLKCPHIASLIDPQTYSNILIAFKYKPPAHGYSDYRRYRKSCFDKIDIDTSIIHYFNVFYNLRIKYNQNISTCIFDKLKINRTQSYHNFFNYND